MAFLILKSKSEEILKDRGIYWSIVVKGLWHNKTVLNSIYDDKDHGISCKCCTPIIKESVTHPTVQEVLQRTHRPGRPRVGKGV